MSLDHYPPNPDYGHGCFRRLILIRRHAGQVLVTVDDTHHSMWLLLCDDGDRIVAVDAAIARGPATSCGQAPAGLAALAGLPIDASSGDLSKRLPAVANCTHLTDLAKWGVGAIRAGLVGMSRIEIEIPDQQSAPVWMLLKRDGTTIHRWQIVGTKIVAPEALAGRPLMQGFNAWAREVFSGESLEAAIMLQRGILVARGRRVLADAYPPVPLREAPHLKGACVSYAGANFMTAVSNIGYVRDFTDRVVPADTPEDILARFEEEVNQ